MIFRTFPFRKPMKNVCRSLESYFFKRQSGVPLTKLFRFPFSIVSHFKHVSILCDVCILDPFDLKVKVVLGKRVNLQLGKEHLRWKHSISSEKMYLVWSGRIWIAMTYQKVIKRILASECRQKNRNVKHISWDFVYVTHNESIKWNRKCVVVYFFIINHFR